MKLPLTDKFLWNVYDFVDGVSDVYTAFSLPSLKGVLYPELAQLRKAAKKRQSKQEFAKFIDYLKRKGYIKLQKRKTLKTVILTKKGWRRVLKIKLKNEKIKKRKDKRWVMVVFDIPEKMRRARNTFRQYLRQLGFQMFQKSIWISPNDVLDKVEKLAKGLLVDEYIKIMLVEEIEV